MGALLDGLQNLLDFGLSQLITIPLENGTAILYTILNLFLLLFTGTQSGT